jgi:hypothetical protein
VQLLQATIAESHLALLWEWLSQQVQEEADKPSGTENTYTSLSQTKEKH